MISYNPFRLTSAVALFALLGTPAAAQSEATQQAQVTSTGWGVQCSNVGDDLLCSALISIVSPQNNQLVLRVSIQPQAESDDHTLVLQLPLGLDLVAGVSLQIDDAEAEQLPVNTCLPAGCFVTRPIDAARLEAMKAGETLSITMTANNGGESKMDLPLSGFAKSVDKLE